MALVLNALAMMLLPLAAALAVRRQLGPRWRWRWLGAGVLAYLLSQLVHLPLLSVWQAMTRSGALPGFGATADALVLGVLAAGCEEPARVLAFRFAAPTQRGREAALAVGVGHGGIEALVLGLLALLGAINVLAARDLDAAGLEALGMAPDAAATAVEQVRVALAMPWYEVFGGAFERALAIPLHLACSVWVMAALRRRRAWPFVVALVAHASVDAAAGLLAEEGTSGWALELELAALIVPFVAGTWLWVRRAEPAVADLSV